MAGLKDSALRWESLGYFQGITFSHTGNENAVTEGVHMYSRT